MFKVSIKTKCCCITTSFLSSFNKRCMQLKVLLSKDQQCIEEFALFLAIFYNFYRTAVSAWCCPFCLFFKKAEDFRLTTLLKAHVTLVLANILLQQSLPNRIQRFPITVVTIYYKVLFIFMFAGIGAYLNRIIVSPTNT